MNQVKYQDVCKACGQPCARTRRVNARNASTRWVTSCCQAPPVAVEVAVKAEA